MFHLQIYPNDGLPEQICRDCADKLATSFCFKEQCEKSDKFLRKYKAKSSEGSSKQEDREITRQTDNNSPSSFIFVDCNPLTDTDSETELIMVDSPMQLSPSSQEATSNMHAQNCDSQPESQINHETSDTQTKQDKLQNNLLPAKENLHDDGNITKSDYVGGAVENTKSNFNETCESNQGGIISSFKQSSSKVSLKGKVKSKKGKEIQNNS